MKATILNDKLKSFFAYGLVLICVALVALIGVKLYGKGNNIALVKIDETSSASGSSILRAYNDTEKIFQNSSLATYENSVTELLMDSSAFDDSGLCGNNVQWGIDLSTGELKFWGTGEMIDLKGVCYEMPWKRNYSNDIKTVTILNGVTSICDYAFYNCGNIVDIAIPSSIKSIGDWALLGCTSLKSITIPSSVKSIGDRMLFRCTGLKSATILTGATCIGIKYVRRMQQP
ncbi:MAG: leucine-rich repeat domain-containing protein [Clostridiaceae bacterium]|nr:leucine-rich repeat domain-containing protein [Clostridiaceae bacterium]